MFREVARKKQSLSAKRIYEIRNFGNATLCYELRPEHITGKTVNES